MKALQGIGASPGRAVARALLHPDEQNGSAQPRAADVGLEDAVRSAVAALRESAESLSLELGEDMGRIFSAQAAMLEDPEFLDQVRSEVRSGLGEVKAVELVSRQIEQDLESLNDPLLAGRAADVRDAAEVLIAHLTGSTGQSPNVTAGERVIVVARQVLPSQAVRLSRDRVAGLVTESGGVNSHVSILAREFGIPAVVGVSGIVASIQDGQFLAIDGDTGTVVLDPDAPTQSKVRIRSGAREPRLGSPAPRTSSGEEIHVLANATSPEEVADAIAAGADGIGLYRTEVSLLRRQSPATAEDQRVEYVRAIEAAKGRPITFRLLDLGSDKLPLWLPKPDEPNPALGLRGIRYLLAHPYVLREHLTALIDAAGASPNASLMLPMVADDQDVTSFREVLARTGTPSGIAVGAMVEVPSAVLLIDTLSTVCDFFSIGTNDLTQYLLAVDRENSALSVRYSDAHPAVMRAIADVVNVAGHRRVSVCGELAGNPVNVARLLSIGLCRFSVGVRSVRPVRAAIARVLQK